MKKRLFGNSTQAVSEIGLGCWQLGGGDWGAIADADAFRILDEAVDRGITFIDTADVYGAGRSEQLIGDFLRQRRPDVFVASKAGRRNYPGPYSKKILKSQIQESLLRLKLDTLDLLQLHCIPGDVMVQGDVFDWLRDFQSEGLIRHFGASVESMDEALSILDQDGLTSLQIIFNIFRQKPISTLFELASAKGLGLIVRLPLASGLLAGKFSVDSTFPESDHRHYNRDGACFNVGETFAGLPFAKGLEFAEAIRPLVPAGMSMAQFAQRWILDHPAVSTVITGASRPEQVADNAAVSELPSLAPDIHAGLFELYRDRVHGQIRGVY
jgi:aryl-alcohol dehydrogenase-like predicted oxidoreductase